MLMPKRVKFRKAQRGRMRGKATRGERVNFGDFGLKALEPGWITQRQIEAARVTLTRMMKREGTDLDPHLPGQAGDEEAGRDPYGKREGCAGVLGGGDQAGACDVRSGWHDKGHGARSTQSGIAQAADQDENQCQARLRGSLIPSTESV